MYLCVLNHKGNGLFDPPYNIALILSNMSLKSQVESGIKDAMRAKDQDTLRALRAIKSLILLEETKGGQTGELSAEDELKLLTKAAKQRRESMEVFVAQGRNDLAEKEEAELVVVERFLPKQLTEDEVKEKLKEIIARVGASSPAEIGKVMGVATKELAGQAEGKVISALAKSLLA
ncbi:GatB/YqeY domain-containing protein [Ravibacter arvi]|uniref:GatB/YqeY domain-containing protein n=2 Tax=Ravibacter arvi TaxID=2051041 RepID=A0ABP8LUG3_9BACT